MSTYITQKQFQMLIASVRGDNSFRDVLILETMYRHGLRASEVALLQWSDIDFSEATLFVTRLKGSKSSLHHLEPEEVRAFKKWKGMAVQGTACVFPSREGTPISRQMIYVIVQKAAQQAGLVGVHPHSLRHGRGYKLVNANVPLRVIQDFLGHKNIQHTVRYTALDSKRFRGLSS